MIVRKKLKKAHLATISNSKTNNEINHDLIGESFELGALQ